MESGNYNDFHKKYHKKQIFALIIDNVIILIHGKEELKNPIRIFYPYYPTDRPQQTV